MELKELIRNSEERFVFYKKQLGFVNMEREVFIPEDEFVVWYKSFLRDSKNEEEKWLKGLIDEKRNENQGLNPPFTYIIKKK